MMPFIVGETFEACKLPEKIRPYWAMIKSCLQPEINRAWHHMWPNRKIPSELGKVNYLTIQESWVEEGSTQRRILLSFSKSYLLNYQKNLEKCVKKAAKNLEKPEKAGKARKA